MFWRIEKPAVIASSCNFSRSDPAFRFYGLARTFCCIRIRGCVAVSIVKEHDQYGQLDINNNPYLNVVNNKKQ